MLLCLTSRDSALQQSETNHCLVSMDAVLETRTLNSQKRIFDMASQRLNNAEHIVRDWGSTGRIEIKNAMYMTNWSTRV